MPRPAPPVFDCLSAAARFDATDASHDLHHARRVKWMALALADGEGDADRAVLVAAAYLHDIVNLPKDAPDRDQASRRSAEVAGPILARTGLSEPQIGATCRWPR